MSSRRANVTQYGGKAKGLRERFEFLLLYVIYSRLYCSVVKSLVGGPEAKGLQGVAKLNTSEIFEPALMLAFPSAAMYVHEQSNMADPFL